MTAQSLAAILAALAATALAGCGEKTKATPPAKDSPATVAKPGKEDELNTVVLKPEAEARLGLKTVEATTKPVARSRTYAGDVIVPPGRLIIVSAPFAAKIAVGGKQVVPGQSVKKGDVLVTLLPTLSADALNTLSIQKNEADGLVTSAKEQVDIEKLAVARVEKLKGTVGAGAIEDANNKLGTARTALKNAEARRDDLEKKIGDAGADPKNSQALTSPADGILRNAQVSPGQQVATAQILFEVETLDPIWVRVPVYVGDLKLIAIDKDARVGSLSGKWDDRPAADKDARAVKGEASSIVAKPAAAPPSADPLALTVDLFYEVPNPKGTYRPGQRLGVAVPLTGESTGLVVPSSAIYYDIWGGSWAYEQTKEHTFVRRRVEVEQVVDGTALITRGLKPGSKIVTVAVAELYGTDFAFAK